MRKLEDFFTGSLGFAQDDDLLRPARDRGVVDPAAIVGDQARADLDHQSARAGDDGLFG